MRPRSWGHFYPSLDLSTHPPAADLKCCLPSSIRPSFPLQLCFGNERENSLAMRGSLISLCVQWQVEAKQNTKPPTKMRAR